MKIAGIQKNSFVDYPDKLSAVIFTLGCNMNCYYCHNRDIIKENNQDLISPDYFLDFIKTRKTFLEGVVISGGEPTLQTDLIEYIKSIKDIGYKIKLDTNGSNPHIINSLLERSLIDYIAMDIKAPMDKYNEICGIYVNIENILKSINLLMSSEILYEFRTTFVPQFDISDIYKIVESIKGAKKFVIQQYRKPANDNGFYDKRFEIQPIDKKQLVQYGERIKTYFERFEIRGI